MTHLNRATPHSKTSSLTQKHQIKLTYIEQNYHIINSLSKKNYSFFFRKIKKKTNELASAKGTGEDMHATLHCVVPLRRLHRINWNMHGPSIPSGKKKKKNKLKNQPNRLEEQKNNDYSPAV